MGGRPVTALNLVAFPEDGDPDILLEIIRGGHEKMAEAGCTVIGGHSIRDPEIKFGYAVTGLVHPGRIWRNNTARPGDVLVLSKPLGTGIVTTALKRGLASAESVRAATESMLQLNRNAAEVLQACRVSACTDVTGFGLIGHLCEMAAASGVAVELEVEGIQFLPGAVEYARAGAIPGGLKSNRQYFECRVELRRSVEEAVIQLLYDPQTSGGLLAAIAEADLSRVLKSIPGAFRVGRLVPAENNKLIYVV